MKQRKGSEEFGVHSSKCGYFCVVLGVKSYRRKRKQWETQKGQELIESECLEDMMNYELLKIPSTT